MTHIPLTRAYLCPNCDEIGDNPHRCEACGGEQVLSLGRVLNRATEKAPARASSAL